MQVVDRIVKPIVHIVQICSQRCELCYEVDGCFIAAGPTVVQLPKRVDPLSQSVYVRPNGADELVHSFLARRRYRHCATGRRDV